ncbi:hypothetical protein PG987_006237 [Apiospora arundinis]
MPKYWVKDADRSGLPVLSEEQRKQIRTCFVDYLGHKFYVESLYYCLREALIGIASKDAGFEETAKYKTEWCTLKVSNLAVYVHEEDLYELFGKYGEVTFVYLLEDHRKAALEQKKTMLLGDALGPRVFLAYNE